MPCSSWQAYTPAAVLSPPPCLTIMSHYLVPPCHTTMSHHLVSTFTFTLSRPSTRNPRISISLLHAKPSSRPIPPLLAKPLSKLIALRRLLCHIRMLNGSYLRTLEHPNCPPTTLYPTSPRSRVSTQTSKPTISPMCLLIVQDFLRPNQSTAAHPPNRHILPCVM